MKTLIKEVFKKILPKKIINLIWNLKRIANFRVVRGPLTYNLDGLATRHNCDFMNEWLFKKAYIAGKKTGSWKDADIFWRAHLVCWAANMAKNIEGDFVECGVNKGGLAMVVATYVNLNTLNKNFYLLDTFCGLPEKYISPEEKTRGVIPGGFEECYDDVKRIFKDYPNVKIIRGMVPDTLPQVDTDKVAYLSIDMNCSAPEIAAAEYFWDKIVRGGIIVLDDYGYEGHIIQKHNFDDFALRNGVQILQIPTGQGLIFKQ